MTGSAELLFKVALYVFCMLLGVLLLAPVLVVIPLSFTDAQSFIFPPENYSFRWYDRFWSDPQWRSALNATLVVTALTVGVSTTVGTMAAMGARLLPPKARSVIAGFVALPILIPGVILAVADYIVFLRIDFVGTYHGFAIANSVLALPLVYLPVSAALSNFDPRLERASASLGANRWTTFIRVTLPLIAPGVIAGALFAFVVSWDEVLIGTFLSTPDLRTLPVLLYSSLSDSIDPTVAAISSMTVGLVVVAIVLFFVARFIRPSRRYVES